MKREIYADYVSYDIQSYFRQKPDDPTRCPMCMGNLSKSDIEPSKAMRKEIVGPDYDYGTSLLFVCNECRWWCVREHCEFVDGQAARRYGIDYLIYGRLANNERKAVRMMPVQYAQPWLIALEDPRVYDKVARLPKELALLLEGGVAWKNS